MKRPNSGNRENCKLVDENGKLVLRMTFADMLAYEKRGKCRRIAGGTWQLFPQPSSSEESPCSLTVGDMHKAVEYLASGTKITEQEFERFAGWGLITNVSAYASMAAVGA